MAISVFVGELNAVGNPLRGLDEGLKREQGDVKSIHLWVKKNPLSIVYEDFAETESNVSSSSIVGVVSIVLLGLIFELNFLRASFRS